MFEVFFKSGLIDLHGWALKVLGVQGGFAKMSDLEGQKTSFQVKNPGFGLKSPFFGQKPSLYVKKGHFRRFLGQKSHFRPFLGIFGHFRDNFAKPPCNCFDFVERCCC